MTQTEYVKRLEGWALSAAEELQDIRECMQLASGDDTDGAHLQMLLEDLDNLMAEGGDAQP